MKLNQKNNFFYSFSHVNNNINRKQFIAYYTIFYYHQKVKYYGKRFRKSAQKSNQKREKTRKISALHDKMGQTPPLYFTTYSGYYGTVDIIEYYYFR